MATLLDYLNPFRKGKKPTDPIEAAAVLDGSAKIEAKARNLVLDYIERYEQEFNVFFITTEWQTRREGEDACLVLGIYTSSPGKVIGVQGANAQKISSYIGSFLKVPIYTKGLHFNPFNDALPK